MARAASRASRSASDTTRSAATPAPLELLEPELLLLLLPVGLSGPSSADACPGDAPSGDSKSWRRATSGWCLGVPGRGGGLLMVVPTAATPAAFGMLHGE